MSLFCSYDRIFNTTGNRDIVIFSQDPSRSHHALGPDTIPSGDHEAAGRSHCQQAPLHPARSSPVKRRWQEMCAWDRPRGGRICPPAASFLVTGGNLQFRENGISFPTGRPPKLPELADSRCLHGRCGALRCDTGREEHASCGLLSD